MRRKARILAVSGGKGGTGKTYVAVNLAVQMALRLGTRGARVPGLSTNRVLVFDADYHLSNAHLFLGEKLSPCLDRFLDEPSSLPNFISSTRFGVDLISFGGDERRVNTLENRINARILEELRKLERSYEWIIVDTGAGLSETILRQVIFADHALLVLNPVITSIVDTYKVLKFLWLEKKQRAVDICLNMVASYEEGYACFRKLQSTLRQFSIPMRIFFAGALYSDPPRFMRAIHAGHPAALVDPPNHVSESIDNIWDHVLKGPGQKAVDSFFTTVFLGA